MDVPFFLGRAGSPSNTVTWAEAYRHTKWHLSPSSRLATTDIGRKLGGCAPSGEGELCPHLTQCHTGQGLPQYQVASWSMQLFGQNRCGPKIGRALPFLGRGLAAIKMGRKWGLYPLFWGGELGYHLTQCRLGRGLTPYQVASWSIQLFGYNRYGPKIGRRFTPFLGRGWVLI